MIVAQKEVGIDEEGHNHTKFICNAIDVTTRSQILFYVLTVIELLSLENLMCCFLFSFGTKHSKF